MITLVGGMCGICYHMALVLCVGACLHLKFPTRPMYIIIYVGVYVECD